MAVKRSGVGGKRSQPAQDPPLSRERIAAAAVAILDSDGVDGLTMRRLAQTLGAGVMSLYWHVDNKEGVLDLALDSVLEYHGPPRRAASRGWRGDVLHLLDDWRAIMLRHPWSAFLLPRQVLGGNILGRMERLGKTLSEAGVAQADLNAAIWSLWNFVIGAAVTRASFELSVNVNAHVGARLEHLGQAHPTIERSRLLLDDDWNGVFRKGVEFLLDGLVRESPRRG